MRHPIKKYIKIMQCLRSVNYSVNFDLHRAKVTDILLRFTRHQHSSIRNSVQPYQYSIEAIGFRTCLPPISEVVCLDPAATGCFVKQYFRTFYLMMPCTYLPNDAMYLPTYLMVPCTYLPNGACTYLPNITMCLQIAN